MKLCLRCRDFVGDATVADDRCSTCGSALLDDTPEHRARLLDALVYARLPALLDEWREGSMLKAGSARRIQAWVAEREAELVAPTRIDPAADLPPQGDASAALFAPEPEAPAFIDFDAPRRAPAAPEPVSQHEDNDTSPVATAFSSSEAAHGAVDAFVALDAPEPPSRPSEPSRWETEVRPLLYENIGWFIGTLFVLAGSVYGVREAWRTLGGVERHLLVAAAFMAYHAGFAGIAKLLGSRSATTGRVLGGIAIGLLPVVFVALSSLSSLNAPIGAAASIACAALATFTLRSVSRRFESAGALASSVIPVLVAQVPMASLAPSSWVRVLLGFVGVASVAWAGLSSFPDRERAPDAPAPPSHPVVAALYATAALVVFALTGASDAGSDLARLSAGFSFTVASLASTLVLIAGRASARAAFPRGAGVAEVLSLGALSVAVVSAVVTSQQTPEPTIPGLVAAGTALLATVTFAQTSSRHPGALHFVVPLASVAAALVTRSLVASPDVWWPAGTILAACAGLFAARAQEPASRARRILLRWSVVTGVSLTLYALYNESFTVTSGRWTATAVTATLFALSAHLAGEWTIRSLHLIAGPSLALGLTTFGRSAGWWPDRRTAWVSALLGLGVAYGVLAIPYESLAERRGKGSRFEVIDDLSRLALVGAVLVALIAFQSSRVFYLPLRVWDSLGRDQGALVAAAGVALVARAFRDRSRYVALAGALALGYAAHLASGADALAHRALVTGALTLGAAVVATLLGQFDRARYTARTVEARHFLREIPLPGRSVGVGLARDAFADAAVVGFALGAAHVALWIASWDNLSRPWTVEGGALLIGAGLLAFLSPGFVDRRARGATATLFITAAGIALTAVANRIGRPLPPPVIGLRLTLIAAAVWGLRQVAERYGPALARWLENPAEGAGYKRVFSVGVVVLAFVMAADAALVGLPSLDRALLVTPPLLLLGAALALTLMARATRMTGYWLPAGALVIPGVAALAAQRSLVGVALEPAGVIATHWVPTGSLAAAVSWRWNDPLALLRVAESLDLVRARAVLGVAGVAAVFSLASMFIERSGDSARRVAFFAGETNPKSARVLRGLLALWASVAAAVVLAAVCWRGHLFASALVTLAGVALVGARVRRAGVPGTMMGLMAVTHSLATTQAQTPWWVAPAWMSFAMVALHVSPWIARRYELDPEDVYERTHPLALAVSAAALPYALATDGVWTNNYAILDVLWNALTGLGGRWMSSPSLPLTLALAAWCAAVAAAQWQAEDDAESAAYRGSAGAVVLAGFAAWTGLTVAYVTTHATVSAGAWTLPFARGLLALRTLGTPLVLTSALVAGVAHASNRYATRAHKTPLALGARWGRDAMLVAMVAWAAVFAGLATQPGGGAPPWALAVGVAGFTAGVLAAGHAAWTEATARHVYFIQTAIVAVYGLVRTELARDLPPEADAVFGLVMGFLLVGVTVQARRAGIPPVAEATRRFAALLPLGVALVMPQQATVSTAMAAAGSALLYGTLGYLEKSRLLGSLGAAAGNLALLLFALSQGLQGVEIWLAPAGLLVLAIGQIFGDSLAHPSRVTLRVVGSLLLYLPSAAQIALQVGNARDGTYPVVFGLACLTGIAAGMMLHIRAYLALGLSFLVLDVVASLVHAGLRDHRVGFLLLSAAGLGILGVMVFLTLKRDAVRAWTARWRTRLRRWD